MGSCLMKYKQITPDDIEPFLKSPDWHLQQKLDGIRARLVVEGSKASVLGNTGGPLVSTTAMPVVRDILRYAMDRPGSYSLEGEIIGSKWWIYDMPMSKVPWVQRLTMLHNTMRTVHSSWMRICPTAMTADIKRKAWDAILREGVEGAVLKHVNGTIVDGDKRVSHVLKCKVTHTIDAFVTERGIGNGYDGTDNWLSFAVLQGTAIKHLGRCSTIGKPYANVGDVIELKYLYVGAGGKLVQPTHLRNRPDKTPDECTTEQLKFVSKTVVTF